MATHHATLSLLAAAALLGLAGCTQAPDAKAPTKEAAPTQPKDGEPTKAEPQPEQPKTNTPPDPEPTPKPEIPPPT